MAVRPLASAPPASNAPVIMVAMIAAIIFSVEMAIMLVLERLPWQFPPYVTELLDATLLTLIASPMIFFGVTRPFAVSAQQAHAQLHGQLDQTQRLLAQNERLSQTLRESSLTTSDIHERILQKVGAELHDGAAQVLTFALLQLDRFEPLLAQPEHASEKAEFDKLARVLGEALREIRGLSMGLSLPELDNASLADTIDLAVRRYREMRQAPIAVSLDGLAPTTMVSLPHRVCIYRIVQEALANAGRHGRPRTQTVTASGDSSSLMVSVSDDGIGFDPQQPQERGLGLLGMRARVQSLGGQFDVRSAAGAGTTVTARFNIASDAPHAPQARLH